MPLPPEAGILAPPMSQSTVGGGFTMTEAQGQAAAAKAYADYLAAVKGSLSPQQMSAFEPGIIDSLARQSFEAAKNGTAPPAAPSPVFKNIIANMMTKANTAWEATPKAGVAFPSPGQAAQNQQPTTSIDPFTSNPINVPARMSPAGISQFGLPPGMDTMPATGMTPTGNFWQGQELFTNTNSPGLQFIPSSDKTSFFAVDPGTAALPVAPLAPPQTASLPPSLSPPPMTVPQGEVLPPVASAPPPPNILPPVNAPAEAPLPPPSAPAPAAPAASAPPAPQSMPPEFNPLASLAAIQSQAAPMANPVAGPTPPNSANQMPALPQATPIDGGSASPLSPLAPPAIGAPNTMPGSPQPGPVVPQTLGESVGGQMPSTAAPAGTPGLAAGGDAGVSPGMAPGLAPPTEEAGPSAIPFKPNAPTPGTPNLGANASIEDFMGSLGGLEFGPGGILGVPGGQKRAAGQSEADFLRGLMSQGLMGGRL